MSQETSNYQLYLDDPRLRMTLAGRSLVRVISYVGYLVLFVAMITFLLSYDIRSLFFLGLLVVLIIIDLLVHKGQGDMRISELPKEGRINVASVIAPSAFLMIERAMDASIITKKSFLLELTSKLLEMPDIEDGLRRLDIKPEEFKQKLGSLLAESSAGPESYIRQVQLLTTHAFTEAINAGHDFIKNIDLFSSLPKMNDESLNRLFALFSIDQEDLGHALIFSSLSGRSGLFKRLPETPTAQVTDAEVQKMLIHESVHLEKKLKIKISFGAIKRAIILAKKYHSDQSLLPRARELLMAALNDAEQRGEKVLTSDRVMEVAEEKEAQDPGADISDLISR